MDFSSFTQTPLLVLLNILVMLYFFVLIRPALKNYGNIPNDWIVLAKFLIILFCLFSFWGVDWFHYAQIFAKIKKYGGTHMEDVYVSIAQFSPNYLVFRFIIWGSAVFLVFDFFKRINVNYVLALLIFSATSLIWFSYARVSLAMALMFWGVSVVFNPLYGKKLLSYVVGISAIVASFYFHKTAAFGIGIIGIAFLANKLKGRSILILSALLIPIEFLLIQHYLLDFMLVDARVEEGAWGSSIASGQHYLGKETVTSGIGSNIAKFLELLPYYLTAYCCLKLSGKKHLFEMIPISVKAFVYIAFYFVLFASIFAFDFGYSTEILYGRFMRFAFLPCVVVVSYCYEIVETHKIAKYIVYLGMASTMYQLLYVLYCTFTKL